MNGIALHTMPPEKRNISLVYQNFGLFPFLTVFENTVFGEKLRGTPKQQYTAQSERLLMVGYQPAMIEQLHTAGFTMRVLDLNPDNIGDVRYGVTIEDGQNYEEAIEWATVILCTGSTIINGTITHFSEAGKPVYFYGTTIVGAAVILGLQRLCEMM